MILDNIQQLNQINEYDTWVINPIYLDNRYHAVENRISCLYIVNTIHWDDFLIPIEHTEKHGDIQLENVINYLNENEIISIVHDKKSALNHLLGINNLYDLQLLYYLNNDEWHFDELFNDYYHRWDKFSKINTMIPLSIIYDRFNEFYGKKEKEFDKLTGYKEITTKESYKNYDEVIKTFYEVEKNGICKDNHIKYTQYYIYTSTGRPSNRFGGVNYAALNKSDDTRKHYTSRFENGALYLYDYQAFHPTILSNYLKIGRPEGISVHEWLGRKYFEVNELTDEQYKDSKKKTFFYLYGDDILHEDVEDIEFFQKVAEFKRTLERKDVIETPIFKRMMNVENMSLSKKFNYFLQCFESEINFVKMKQLNKYLRKKESKLVLYTYDSFLIDYNENDGNIVNDIQKLLERGNFSVTIEKGNNYKDMQKIV